MRFMPLIMAVFLLASSVTASACHSVGDVHVICKNGTISALYVENKGKATEAESPDCCPMAGFALAEIAQARPVNRPLDTQTTPLPHSAPMMRADAPARPRGPPTELFF
jgi:hypothetical protein